MLWQVATYMQVVRFFDCLCASLVAIEGYWLTVGRFVWPGRSQLLAAVAVFAAVAFANVLNDLCDQEADRINCPHRALVAGRLAPAAAVRLAGVLFGVSLLAGLLASLPMLLLTAVALLLSAVYNLWAKKLLAVGHAVAALTLALTLLAGYCSTQAGSPPLLPALAALLFLLARELIKSLCDAPGDHAAGRRSIAALWGSRHTLWVCLGLLLLSGGVLVLAAAPDSRAAERGLFLGAIIGMIGLLCVLLGLVALRGPRRPQVRALAELSRLVMLAGVAALLGLV